MTTFFDPNPNCGRCGHLNNRGFCNMTACAYPMQINSGTYIATPQTNYDRLISKTPEELSVLLGESCPPGSGCLTCKDYTDVISGNRRCDICWLDWLRQEIKHT